MGYRVNLAAQADRDLEQIVRFLGAVRTGSVRCMQ